MFNRNFANDCIRTTDLWSRKWPLYQLSNNHCPYLASHKFCHTLQTWKLSCNKMFSSTSPINCFRSLRRMISNERHIIINNSGDGNNWLIRKLSRSVSKSISKDKRITRLIFCGEGAVGVELSVTRFGEISPLWWKFKSLCQFLGVYLVFGKIWPYFGKSLILGTANIIFY